MPRRSPTALKSPPHGRAAAPAGKLLLKDRAYAELKRLIQSGAFPPDTFLSERQLVERLGMSKTPIRSALEHLESQGLVAVSPQQGIVVRDLSVREIRELFDMRAAVEPFVVERLAERRLTREQSQRVKSSLSRQRAAVRACDPLAATTLDIEFHRLLAELVDNREMAYWLDRCFDKLQRAILRVNRLAPGRLAKSYEDHAGIAASILHGRPSDAAKRVIEHLGYGRQFLLNA
jgi:GntR family transcriptional regulator, rspAB operon transcriptional repressor